MKPTVRPPLLASRLFEWYCHPHYHEEIQGDLLEEYSLKAETSARRANRWYWWQIIRLFRPAIIRNFPQPHLNHNEMDKFINYLKIGIRNLWKYKSATAINTTGLATGLAAFILVLLYVKDELSYDQHYTNADQLYRLTVKNFDLDGRLSRQWAFASAGHATRLKEDYPEVTHATRFFPWAFPDIRVGEQVFPAQQVIFADDDALSMFDFPFLEGNPATAFTDLYSLVLTEATAIRLFGTDWRERQILGETVTLARGDQQAPFKITGVMQDMPDQQHFHFEYLAPIRFIEALFGENTMNNVTGNYNWPTYLMLAPGTDPSQIEARKDEFFDKYVGEFGNGQPAKDFYDFELQPITSIHLHSNLEGEFETNGSIAQVYLFSVVGVLLLLIACVNYMNISTSHFSRRMKEIAVRKVTGAYRSDLMKQFLTESLLVNCLAFPVAILLSVLVLPSLNDFMDKQLSLSFMANYQLLGTLVALLLLSALLAGSYPSIFLSKINLTTALKGESAIRTDKWNFRNWLVTFQYVVTIGLIFMLVVVESQITYIQNYELGYEKHQVIDLRLTREIQNLETFKQELLRHPSILKASYASRIPTGRLADSQGAGFFASDTATALSFRLPYISVDEDFLEAYQIPLIAGSPFTQAMDMRTDSVGYYLINRAAAEALGFSNPNDIVGKKLSYGQYNDQVFRAGRILGVTENFHFESLHTEVGPMVMLKTSANINRVSMLIRPENVQQTLAHVEEVFTRFDSKNDPNIRFLDDLFAAQYQAEERLGTLVKVFTGLAIFISCLGLIGMVGFLIETKYKEIGIRKVMGAPAASILLLIGKRFFVLMGIALLISIPVTFWLASSWLSNFAYHTYISWWMLLLPVVAISVVTAITISYQTLSATRLNPVVCLKTE